MLVHVPNQRTCPGLGVTGALFVPAYEIVSPLNDLYCMYVIESIIVVLYDIIFVYVLAVLHDQVHAEKLCVVACMTALCVTLAQYTL